MWKSLAGIVLGMAAAAVAAIAPIAAVNAQPPRVAAVDARITAAADCAAFAEQDISRLEVPAMILGTELVESTNAAPEYCAVRGIIQPQIQFEMRLPTRSWNGRYFQVGCGGFCGVINIQNCSDALAQDFAVAAHNMGHVGRVMNDPVWGSEPTLRQDFGGRSTHLVAVTSKSIIERFYGQQAAYSYFRGCSTGGREGLQEAQNHPEDFDGIIAGDPAFPARLGALANNWDARHLLRADRTEVFSPAKLQVLAKAVLASCDTIDGIQDGIIMDPRRCRFDIATLECQSGDGADCLTTEQITAARALYRGPVNSAGQALSPGATPFGSELSWSGRGRLALANGYLRYLGFEENPPANYDYRTFNWDTDPAWAEAMAALYDPVAPREAPDLSAFQRAGGKLIVYHGWSDAGVTPYSTLDYHSQVAARQGGHDSIASWLRLFMVPGMFHCRGGNAPNTFDLLPHLVAWVERGIAPDRIVAEQREEGRLVRSRPLFSYPAYAEYDGNGDLNDESNWRSARPTGPVDDRLDWIWAPREAQR